VLAEIYLLDIIDEQNFCASSTDVWMGTCVL
jgi:hypothetical protein